MKHKLIGREKVHRTCLRGFVEATRAEITAIFGEPNLDGAGDKAQWEWVIEFENGLIATIYDYKTYTPEFASEGIYLWHIGGHRDAVRDLVGQALSKQTYERPVVGI